MKYLLLSSLLTFSLTGWSQDYYENDGSVPELLDEKSDTGSFPVTKKISTTEAVIIEKEEAPIEGGGAVSTDEMNTAPNPAPQTKGEVLEDSTLSSGPIEKKGGMEAQEENALDYSTTPQKRTTKPLGPNKK